MEPINLIPWVLVGAIAGWLASKTIKSDFWSIFDTLVGMVGAVAGGFLFTTFGQSGATGFSLVSIFAAFVGAILLLLITRVFSRTPRVSPPINNDGI
jgi:uncharacterized membrane protein YeaQ/YmgE (transglycosylase-associated protein family)